MKNTKQKRQRYTRRHRNSPNYARWYEIVNWASWITFGLGMILWIIGLGLLGDPQLTEKTADIIWGVGLGVWVLSLILSLVLIWIDDEYESEVQANMIKGVQQITPEEWQNIGNHMANLARTYQEGSKNTKSSKNNK